MIRRVPEPFRMPALLAGALLCALGANLVAPGHRRLSWRGWVPPPTLDRAAAPMASAPPPPALPAPAPGPAPIPAGPSARTPAPPPAQAHGAPAARTAFAPVPDQPIREISSLEAWTAFQGRVPFLDARRSEAFAAAHISGARSAPVWESTLDTRITQFEADLNPAPRDPIVLYCDGGGCEDSHLLARKLMTLGYRNLLIYRDGFPDWTAQGHPQTRGERP